MFEAGAVRGGFGNELGWGSRIGLISRRINQSSLSQTSSLFRLSFAFGLSRRSRERRCSHIAPERAHQNRFVRSTENLRAGVVLHTDFKQKFIKMQFRGTSAPGAFKAHWAV